MDEVQRWILSLLKPEERPTTRALKEGFISTELLTRYCKLIGHRYRIIYVQSASGEDNIIPDVQLGIINKKEDKKEKIRTEEDKSRR
ncbi:hypothetical protein H5410_031767 [Solanum commersonii]|uniref:Uncharacterized protein n=1 Tax=Solanum commersonii TaxID=4109 RepID=A0A9J5YK57_SOLCO|nr:hypothetical protein H5410_031767 [Solanum commersonii]